MRPTGVEQLQVFSNNLAKMLLSIQDKLDSFLASFENDTDRLLVTCFTRLGKP
jgi:hypothetical protein